MEYKEKYEIGSNVTAERTYNGEIITGEFGGFYLLDKTDPKSIVGIVHTPNGSSYDVESNSIKPVISENEKMRNEIISIIEQYVKMCEREDDPCSLKDINKCIAWLEKQGEQKVDKCKDCNNVKGCIICTDGDQYAHITEQKPTDKTEPKFKVGDWIINSEGMLRHIVEVDKTGYQTDNGWLTHDDYEKGFHLWTIQDAKDGDVLASHECLVLFKEIDGLNIKCYCTYFSMNNPGFFINTLQYKNAFKPATKEQRDLLFAKMKEAGYEWDYEKKELKKIKQNPTDKTEPKFKVKYAGNEYNVFEVKDIAGVTYYGIEDEPNHIDYVKAESCEMISDYAIKENGLPYPTKPAVFSEQSPAWSEEDERMFKNTIALIETIEDYNKAPDGFGDVKFWLESIKKRMKGE